jgi:DNA-binding transcriptional regulator LsrR (DeoR family)
MTSRRKRKPLTDEDRIKIALARFSGNPFKHISVLAQEFDRDPAVISNAITQAFQKKLVTVTIQEKQDEQLRRAENLEREIVERFDPVDACIVIEDDNSATSKEFGDELHAKLGRAMAVFISNGYLFREGDVIGLGSGRGVYHTVQSLAKLPKLRSPKKITIESLTGALYVRDHKENINLYMDADNHVNLLGVTFSHHVNLHSLVRPLVSPNKPRLSETLKRIYLGDSKWKEKPATHALVGVGVLSEGHRFYKEVKRPPAEREPSLEPIIKFLEPLVNLSEEIEHKYQNMYCPVGDICNRLFYVSPPKRVKIPDQDEIKIKELIGKINEVLLTISEDQLHQIGTIMLVAGGIIKAPAIRQLLDSQYKIRILCTDKRTAEEIIRDVY